MTNEIAARETPTEIDRLFDDLRTGFRDAFGFVPFGPWTAGEFKDGSYLRAARTDVSDTGTAFRIVAEVPGIPKEKLDIRVRGTSVEIRGENAEATDATTGQWVHRERRYAGYYRALELPEPVLADKAKAKVEHGLLELELPKQNPTPSNDPVRVTVE